MWVRLKIFDRFTEAPRGYRDYRRDSGAGTRNGLGERWIGFSSKTSWLTEDAGYKNYKKVEDTKMKSDLTQEDGATQEARRPDPVTAPWGFYFQSGQEEVEDGFRWFETWVKVLRFLRRDLLELIGSNDRERQQKVQEVVDDLIECRLNKPEALGRLNQVLKPMGQVVWWGGLSELASGADDFARRARSHYAGSPSQLQEERLPDFAASLRTFSL